MHCSLCLEGLFPTFSPGHTLSQLGCVHLQEATPGSRPRFCSGTCAGNFSVLLSASLPAWAVPKGRPGLRRPHCVLRLSLKPWRMQEWEPPCHVSVVGEGPTNIIEVPSAGF